MTSTPYGTPTRDAASSPAPRRATLAQDAVTVAIGLWLIGGLFSDGWAHHNVPELEGFFTPWHGVLYFGLLLAGAWFIWLGRAGGRRWYRHLPAGYGWGCVGLGVFGLGGLADMAWHLVLGVEAGVDALLSPSHLVLFTGGLLILTSALRSRWGSGDVTSPVAIGGLALVTALVSFFLLYVSEFTASAPTLAFRALPEGHPQHTASELPATAGLGGLPHHHRAPRRAVDLDLAASTRAARPTHHAGGAHLVAERRRRRSRPSRRRRGRGGHPRRRGGRVRTRLARAPRPQGQAAHPSPGRGRNRPDLDDAHRCVGCWGGTLLAGRALVGRRRRLRARGCSSRRLGRVRTRGRGHRPQSSIGEPVRLIEGQG